MTETEPYRATRLWNEVIAAFQSGMPLKKHRRRIHTHNECFTGAEAVTWLHCYLMNNQNFGPNVTRIQTINLLQKFLKCHVIESVIHSKKKEFLDDSHLYKFNSVLYHHSKPSALCLLQSPALRRRTNVKNKSNLALFSSESTQLQKKNLPECHLVERKIPPNEMKSIWSKVILSRLEALLPAISITDFLEEKFIDGHLIKHNVTRLSKTGVVCLVDKTDDIPHWVISAMKCLANWPNASGSGSCLPNYPGFEKDVFKVVRDFFLNPQVPLLIEFLTPLLLKVFFHFSHDPVDEIKTPTTSSFSKSSDVYQLPSSGAKTSTPLANESVSKLINHQLQETSEGQLLLDDPEVMWEYPSEFYFETDFATVQPITRVISNQCSPHSRGSSYTSSMESIESVSTLSVCSFNQKSVVLQNKMKNTRPTLKAWNSNLYLQDEIKESPLRDKFERKLSHLNISDNIMNIQRFDIPGHLPHHSSQTNIYMCEINDLNTSDLSSKTITENIDIVEVSSSLCGSSQSFCAMQSKEYSSPTIQTPIKCNNQRKKYRASYVKENICSEDLKSSFQLILLFLPSANRRQLHLLLRLMSKVLKNGKFVVDPNTPMRDFLLETFVPAIVQSSDVSHLRLLQVAAFLLDNCESLFQPPAGVKEEVAKICRHSSGRIKYTVDDTCFLTYCEMVSKQQYEEQKASGSTEALKSLLNSIMYDQNISDKERKQRLKQFKNSHPDIYLLQFPEKKGHVMKQKSSFFDKLVNLRM